MLHIDGSYGEGGGQIVRTAVALSVLTNTPITVTNIRANRPVPGLRPQHYTAISCIKTICGATTEGLSIGSKNLSFTPTKIAAGSYSFDVGTAGSMILVFQACLLSTVHIQEPLIIKLRGGTDVRWAPSWDYFANVFLPLLRKIGVNAEAQLHQRGYYPTGGGEATLTIRPAETLKPLQAGEPQSYHHINGIINIANLPEHIATRMKHIVMKQAVNHNLKASLQIDAQPSSSPGTGITLWSESDSTIIGSTKLGEKGVSAEQVGLGAFSQILQEITSEATLDRFMVDQILPYLVLAPQESVCLIRELSNHTQTNMWLVKQFFKRDFKVTQHQRLHQILVR